MEPKDFARVILRRKGTVIAAMAIVVLTSAFASFRKAPEYVAECHVHFAIPAGVETLGSLQTNAEFIKSPAVASKAAKRLGLPVAEVGGKTNVELIPETQIFVLKTVDNGLSTRMNADGSTTVVNVGAQRAADICNAIGNAFSAYKRQQARDELNSKLDDNFASQKSTDQRYREVSEQLDRTNPRDRAAYEALLTLQRRLLARSDQLTEEYLSIEQVLSGGIQGGGELIQPAAFGVSTAAGLKKDLILGAIVGLMFGLGIALVREYMDDTVKDKETTQRDLGLPVLAAMPTEELEGLVEASSPTVEAARTLRSTLASLGFPDQKSVLLITSTLAKSRSTTLASLAAAMAESGRSVLVIGSDLRGGRTHEAFGIANTVGLVNVVRGQVPMERAIRPAPGLDGVFVLPAGPLVANPGELLSSEEMAYTLRRARKWADVLLLDAPPVLAAADASILGAYADGVLLVLSAGRTNRTQAMEAKEQLRSAGATVLGAVLVGTDEVVRRDNGYIGELPSLVPFDNWGDPYGVAEWDDDGVVRATARTAPRNGSNNNGERKKVSAAKATTRPKRASQQDWIGPQRRTSSGTRSNGTRSNGTRSNGTRAAAPRSKPGGTRTAAPRSKAPSRSTAPRTAGSGSKGPRSPSARKTTAGSSGSSRRAAPARATTTRRADGSTTVRMTTTAPARRTNGSRSTTSSRSAPAKRRR